MLDDDFGDAPLRVTRAELDSMVNEAKKTYLGVAWWDSRSFGAYPSYENADDFLKACKEYFKWNEENPLHVAETVKHLGNAKIVWLPKVRVMTLTALWRHVQINKDTWYKYKKMDRWDHARGNILKRAPSKDDEGKITFAQVCQYAEDVIHEQKFVCAAAELLNSNFIARDLAMREGVDLDLKSSDGSMSPQREMSEEDLIKALKERGLPTNILQN